MFIQVLAFRGFNSCLTFHVLERIELKSRDFDRSTIVIQSLLDIDNYNDTWQSLSHL